MTRQAFRPATSFAALAALALGACSGADAQTAPDPAVQQALDRIAIEDMVVEYYAHLGGEDAGAFDDYFTEDAVFDVNGIVANGREEIEALYAGMREEGEDGETATQSDDGGTFRMLLSNPVIEVEGNSARASFIWTGIRNTDIGEPPVLVEQGREFDRLEKVEGEWKFAHRVVIADSGLPEGQYETWTPRADFGLDDL
ncbi:nuclear transport factor 2 family protein [Aurantiacibacter hainanensis]|uniref:nuclear transport factor 2 family protein n=1 Tax=Aurantiacibacter hainanensis TaxID=3076114 RepID=UPI0030C6AF59